MKKGIIAYLLIIAIFLVACAGSSETASDPRIERKITPTVEVTRGNIPGPAPDFHARSREVFNPISAVADPAFIRSLFGWLRRFELNEAAAVWLSILITVIVAFNFDRIRSKRNLDLFLLLLPAFFLVNTIDLANAPIKSGEAKVFGLLYLCLFLSTLTLFIRGVYRTSDKKPEGFQPNLPKAILIVLTIVLFGMNTLLALARDPDDAGYYTNLGAYELLKTGTFPYGNPNLRGGAAATYGPVLYLVHVPYQLILQPITVNLDSGSIAHKILVGNNDANYDGPPILATKLALISLHLLAIVCLSFIGRRLANPTIGWALACLYTGSAYVMGLGGDQYFITGVAYISHLAPAGITLLAFALLVSGRPAWSGIVLALGAGAIYYPLFYLPAWLGYLFWKRQGWVRFILAFGITCVLIGASVLLLTRHGPDESVLRVIYESTVGHQEAGEMYGSSTFSFWSTQPGLTAVWQKQLIEGWYLLRPSVILFAGFLLVAFFIARNRSPVQLAALTAATAIAVQLWKSHAGGSYVEWYYPFFLIAVLAYPLVQSRESQIVPAISEIQETPQASPEN